MNDPSSEVQTALEAQARKADDLAAAMTRDRSEHVGAEKAFLLIAKQMPELAKSFDARVERDDQVGAALEQVRRYVHNVIAHVQGLCESSALKQKSEILLCEGRAQTAQMMAQTMRKEIEAVGRVQAAHAARVEQRTETVFSRDEPDGGAVIKTAPAPASKGGRRVLRSVPVPAPVPVDESSPEVRKAQSEETRRAAKAERRAQVARAQRAQGGDKNDV